MSKWISVEDRLPDVEDRYLCLIRFPKVYHISIIEWEDGEFNDFRSKHQWHQWFPTWRVIELRITDRVIDILITIQHFTLNLTNYEKRYKRKFSSSNASGPFLYI